MEFSSIGDIRSSLLLKEEDDSSPEGKSRLSTPLDSAYRNVAQAIAVIPTLLPNQRKAAAITLLDIAESSLLAVQKMLKRSGTSDSDSLNQVNRLLKQLKQLSDSIDILPISESIVSEDIPEEFDSGENLNDTVEVLAAKVISGPKEKDPPEDPSEEKVEGEDNSSVEVKDQGTDPTDDTSNEGLLPRTFESKTSLEKVSSETGENLRILEAILGKGTV